MPIQVNAMGERPEVDADCFASDLLRVEVGGEKFAFPRKMIHFMRGKDVRNVNEKSNTSGTGSNVCQTAIEEAWNIDYVEVNIYPLPCGSSRECVPIRIHTKLYSPEAMATTSILESTPTTPEKLMQVCTPLEIPMNETEAKKGRRCSYVFKHDNFFLFFEFYKNVYPVEKIEDTKKLVLENILKYQIN